jgi:hypothetical protein
MGGGAGQQGQEPAAAAISPAPAPVASTELGPVSHSTVNLKTNIHQGLFYPDHPYSLLYIHTLYQLPACGAYMSYSIFSSLLFLSPRACKQ